MLITPIGKEMGIQRHMNMICYLDALEEELPEYHSMKGYIDTFR